MSKIITKKIEQILPTIGIFVNQDEISICINHKYLLFVCNVLKKHINFGFNLLTCISGVDLLGSTYRFCVAYDLLSLRNNSRLRIKIYLNEITSVNSVIPIFRNANWWEREVWDLYGIYFQNHPDLRRILTDYGFEGYPMRKDFPLSGYVEVRYDASKKRVVVEPLELAQEFRSFNYETPW